MYHLAFKFTSEVISLQKNLVDIFFQPLQSLFMSPGLIHHWYHSVAVHNMIDPGSERNFEKVLVKLRETW